MTPPSLLLLGAGNMGGALFEAWVEADGLHADRSAVVDPNPSDVVAALCERRGIGLNPTEDRGYDVCVLAVKPQQFAAILPDLDWPGIADTLFVSIAAGTTAGTIRQLLAERAPRARVVRTMPSLPAKVRQGVTLLADAPSLTSADKDTATALMAAAGGTYWCRDEDHLDRVMGITGCSPAYVFLLAEALAAAAAEQGVAPEDARRIAEASVTGAAALLAAEAKEGAGGRDAATLRAAVTSPGGTTQAALAVLDGEGGLRGLVSRAVRAAYDRAKQLAS